MYVEEVDSVLCDSSLSMVLTECISVSLDLLCQPSFLSYFFPSLFFVKLFFVKIIAYCVQDINYDFSLRI
jgi:hypothetical protein